MSSVISPRNLRMFHMFSLTKIYQANRAQAIAACRSLLVGACGSFWHTFQSFQIRFGKRLDNRNDKRKREFRDVSPGESQIV